ncbi:hypothetical protein PENTCL1PPCAC_20760 [Pristionchus entomophagus]|uniref:Zinc transporter ZIP2 n=1 Tax=Pristionchus entomophagus TaxID=358040 RepID=A0AAV5TVN5_9BILA|nr:hypothetical protein PENTCL1PPCAC_20760 [Pristionchus entomophagus]
MDQTLLQILLAIGMLVTTAIAGMVSLRLMSMLTNKDGQPSKKSARWLSLLSCFSGGVFLATCFLDIIPHVDENYRLFLSESSLDWEFPVPYLFMCSGFFLVYLIEEACIKIFSMSGHGHSHGGPPAPAPIYHEKIGGTPDTLRNVEIPLILDEDGDLQKRIDLSRHDQVIEESVKYATSTTGESSFLKSLTFTIAMSFHSVLEGFALGVQDTTSGIITLFVSLLLHKAVEAFSVGLQVSKGNTNRMKAVIGTILIYAMMTPVGSLLGAALQNASIDPVHKLGAVLLFESMAAGTFIYVTFLEVLAREKDNEYNSLEQLLAIFIGFSIIAALQFFTSGHGHPTGHADHSHPLAAILTTTLTPIPGL